MPLGRLATPVTSVSFSSSLPMNWNAFTFAMAV
jgi:hypothetical protein